MTPLPTHHITTTEQEKKVSQSKNRDALSLTVASVAGGILGGDLVLIGLVGFGIVVLPFIWPVAVGFLGAIAIIATIVGIGALISYCSEKKTIPPLPQAKSAPEIHPFFSPKPFTSERTAFYTPSSIAREGISNETTSAPSSSHSKVKTSVPLQQNRSERSVSKKPQNSKSHNYMLTLLTSEVSLEAMKDLLQDYAEKNKETKNHHLTIEKPEDQNILKNFKKETLDNYSVYYDDQRFYLLEKQKFNHSGKNKTEIHKGSMIYDGQKLTSKKIIMSIIPYNEASKTEEEFLRELQLSDRFPKAVNISHSVSKENPKEFLITTTLKLYKKGPLTNCYGHKDELKLQYACDLLSALIYLQEQGICHGDVNPGNVFISGKGRAVLGDFGTTYRISNPNPNLRHQGMDHWNPWEVQFRDVKIKPGKEPLSDLWSAGLIFFEMFFGAKSSQDIRKMKTMTLSDGTEKYVNGALPSDLEHNSIKNHPLALLIYEMLHCMPESRPTARQARDRLLAIAKNQGFSLQI